LGDCGRYDHVRLISSPCTGNALGTPLGGGGHFPRYLACLRQPVTGTGKTCLSLRLDGVLVDRSNLIRGCGLASKSVFERCVALSASERLSERQIGWTGRWTIMGDFVVCTQCLAAQGIDAAHEPFLHHSNCVAEGYGLHPWHELLAVLAEIQPPVAKRSTH